MALVGEGDLALMELAAAVLERQLNKLTVEVAQLREERKALGNDLWNTREEAARLRRESAALADVVAEGRREINTLRAERERLREALKDAHDENMTLVNGLACADKGKRDALAALEKVHQQEKARLSERCANGVRTWRVTWRSATQQRGWGDDGEEDGGRNAEGGTVMLPETNYANAIPEPSIREVPRAVPNDKIQTGYIAVGKDQSGHVLAVYSGDSVTQAVLDLRAAHGKNTLNEASVRVFALGPVQP